jgi:hypothetical protein
MDHWDCCLSESARRDHECSLLFDAIDEVNTFIDIDKCIDCVDDLSQFRNGIAAVVVRFIDTSI